MLKNVGQLRQAIEGLPDQTPLLQRTSMSTLSDAIARVVSARWLRGTWTEDYGEELTPSQRYGEPRQVVIIE